MIPIYEPFLGWRSKWAVWRQLQSGWIGPGSTVKRFKELLEKQHDRYCTVTNSGTSALMLAYWALDLPKDATICCPDYGLPACQNAARLLGYNVKLIDVKADTGCMDVDKLDSYLIGGGTCHCVVYVDHNGYTGEELQRVSRLCSDRNIPLIEDSAVALGCFRAGQMGTLSVLSFSVPKIITTGQGGAVLTNNKSLAARLEQLVDQGGGDWRATRLHSAIGGNFRMPDLQAALGVAQLMDLSRLLEKRAQLWDWYRRDMTIAQDIRPSGWMVTVKAHSAIHANLVAAMVQDAGYDCKRLYQPVHYNLPYQGVGTDFPGAVELYNQLLYLPSSLNLKKKQVEEICLAVGGV